MPNIAESITAQPFSDTNFWLRAGVHLHWALPDAFTHGEPGWRVYPADLAEIPNGASLPPISSSFTAYEALQTAGLMDRFGNVNASEFPASPAGLTGKTGDAEPVAVFNAVMEKKDDLVFPAIPNRWLVIRTGGNLPDKRWLVESDYIWREPANQSDSYLEPPTAAPYATPYPIQNPGDTGPRHRYLGRVREMVGGLTAGGPDDYLASSNLGPPLTAIGYGEPTFHAYYPNCSGILGFWDRDAVIDRPQNNPLCYQVVGFYSETGIEIADSSPIDPIYQFVQQFPDADDAKIRSLLNLPDSISPTTEDKLAAFLKELRGEFHLGIEPGQLAEGGGNLNDALAGCVCYSQVSFDCGGSSQSDSKIEVAVGNTATESLAAYLANQLAVKADNPSLKGAYENQLEALNLTAKLEPPSLDLGAKFEEARHTRTFSVVAGGALWTLRATASGDDVPAKPADHEKFNPNLHSAGANFQFAIDNAFGDALHELNQWQLAYNRGRRVVEDRRRRVYADWYKYIVSSYRPLYATRQDDYPAIDEAKRMVEIDIAWLALLDRFVGELSPQSSGGGYTPGISTQLHTAYYQQLPNAAIEALGQELCEKWAAANPELANDNANPVNLSVRSFFKDGFAQWYRRFLPETIDPTSTVSIPGVIAEVLAQDAISQESQLLPAYQSDNIKPSPLTTIAQHLSDAVSYLGGIVAALNTVRANSIAEVGVAPQSGSSSSSTSSSSNPSGGAALAASLGAFADLADASDRMPAGLFDFAGLSGAGAQLSNAANVLQSAVLSVGASSQAAACVLHCLRAEWKLQTVAAPRFYAPNDPVVLLAGESIPSSDRHGEDGMLHCRVFKPTGSANPVEIAGGIFKAADVLFRNGQRWSFAQKNGAPITNPPSLNDGEITAAVTAYLASFNQLIAPSSGYRLPVPTADADLIAFFADHEQDILDWAYEKWNTASLSRRMSDGRPRHQLFLEWEVDILPIRRMGNIPASTRQYDPEFIRHNYRLDETQSEFLRTKGSPVPTGSSSIFSGRSLLATHSKTVLVTRMEDFLIAETRAWKARPQTALSSSSSSSISAATANAATKSLIPKGNRQERQALIDEFNTNRQAIVEWATGEYQKRLVTDYFAAPVIGVSNPTPVEAERQRLVTTAKLQIPAPDKLLPFYEVHESAIIDWYNEKAPASVHDYAPIETVAAAWDELIGNPGVHFQSQALTGFHNGMIMRRHAFQLPIADPLAFQSDAAGVGTDYQKFTDFTVRNAVGANNRLSPMTYFDFNPLRTGQMRLLQLRMVDTFGEASDIPVARQDVVTTEQMAGMTSNLPNWVGLTPRLSQAARINFRWLSARDSIQETNAQPFTSPICGWILPNHLDNSLMVYDQNGEVQGSIDQTGIWRTAPGTNEITLPSDLDNPYLSTLVGWITEQALIHKTQADPTRFMTDFLSVIDSATENIEPANFAEHKALSLLIGRPLALVRGFVNLELPGLPATHLGWEPFRRRILGQPSKTDDYTEVKFPFRLGEHLQLDDGVIGYFLEDDSGDYAQLYRVPENRLLIENSNLDGAVVQALQHLAGEIYTGRAEFLSAVQQSLGESLFAENKDAVLAAAARTPLMAPQSRYLEDIEDIEENLLVYHVAEEPLSFHHSLEDPPQFFSMLVDPRCSFHCTSGILPTKVLSIPREHYADALKNIAVTFLAAPILTPVDGVRTPFPKEAGWQWSWLERDGHDWSTITTRATVTYEQVANAVLKQWPPSATSVVDPGQTLWNLLVQNGWITPLPGDLSLAEVTLPANPGSLNLTTNLPGAPFTDEDVIRLLHVSETSLAPPPHEARYGHTHELREGWLQLTPDANAS
ncbi:MAG: hypothetical protein AAF585_00890 [Verrucomicrobiota bacterium]